MASLPARYMCKPPKPRRYSEYFGWTTYCEVYVSTRAQSCESCEFRWSLPLWSWGGLGPCGLDPHFHIFHTIWLERLTSNLVKRLHLDLFSLCFFCHCLSPYDLRGIYCDYVCFVSPDPVDSNLAISETHQRTMIIDDHRWSSMIRADRMPGHISHSTSGNLYMYDLCICL
jgi:hypothetical protein